MKAKSKILITQAQLSAIAGSEVITYELAKYFLGIGWDVDICVHYFGDPMAGNFSGLNIGLYSDDNLPKKEYDYIWVHHSFLPARVLAKNSGKAKFIFHHMSPYEVMEFPFTKAIEEKIASIVLANSDETKDALKATGIKESLLFNLGNPAPDYFFRNKKPATKALKSLTVISNHVPEELNNALARLKKSGISCRVIGAGNEEKILVDEKIISNTDLVITIGKTVQYSLLSNTPVYVYDRFGGPGYIMNDKDFRKARDFNFSGRGFEKKESGIIAKDIIDNFQKGSESWNKFHEKYSNEFLLSKKLESVFSRVDEAALKKADVSNYEVLHSEAIQTLARRLIVAHIRLDQASNEHNTNTTKLAEANKKIKDLETEHKEMLHKIQRLEHRYKYSEKAFKQASKIRRKIRK